MVLLWGGSTATVGITHLVRTMRKVHANDIETSYECGQFGYSLGEACCSDLPRRSLLILSTEFVLGPEIAVSFCSSHSVHRQQLKL